jgi:hypothetical protein
MAFPTIPTVAAGRVLSALATNPAGTHTSPNLSSLTKNAGDLLIAIVIIYDGNSTNAEFSSWGGGFTEFADFAGTTTMGIGCAYKWSDGTETGTFTVVSADTSANDSAFFLLSIPGAHSATPPEGGSFATGTSAAADPASFNPAGWDAEDTLWIAVGGSGEVSTTGSFTGIASAPANYSDYADSGISADVVGGVEGAVAFRQLNAASEDVGTFSFDLSNARNSALVIAVRPTPAVTLPLIDQSATLFAPSLTSDLNLALLSQLGQLFAPTVESAAGADNITLPLLSQSGQLFSPSLASAITMPLLDQSGVVFAPALSSDESLPLLQQLGTLFNPAISSDESLPLLSQLAAVFAPQITEPGGVPNITLPLLSQAGAVFAPVVSADEVLPLLQQLGVVFNPTLVANVHMVLLQQLGVVFALGVSGPGGQGSVGVRPGGVVVAIIPTGDVIVIRSGGRVTEF